MNKLFKMWWGLWEHFNLEMLLFQILITTIPWLKYNFFKPSNVTLFKMLFHYFQYLNGINKHFPGKRISWKIKTEFKNTWKRISWKIKTEAETWRIFPKGSLLWSPIRDKDREWLHPWSPCSVRQLFRYCNDRPQFLPWWQTPPCPTSTAKSWSHHRLQMPS